MTAMADVAQARLLQRRTAIRDSLEKAPPGARAALIDELTETDAALQRIEQGSFGRCEKCSGAIGSQRLLAMPAARLCIDCTGKTRARRAR
jgi:RNA polymerase-binding transcription factor DksA